MKFNRKLTLIGSALACGAAVPQTAQAGGIELYEIGTPDVGLASAGYSARAQDASTLFKNPAGMSYLKGVQIEAGAQLLYGDVKFSPDAQTSARLGSGDGGNALGALPGAGFFMVEELSEKFSVGFGAFSYFGLLEKYDDDWVGRYYVQESALVGVSLMPSVSFKATEWLSIGAGMNAMYGYLMSQMAVNNIDPLIGDGQMKLKDEAWGFGANGGVMIEPRKGTRIGATYLSRVNLDFEDRPSFSNLGPGLSAILSSPPQLDVGMQVPQSAMVGFYHELGPKWAILADVGWQDWSQFGKVDAGVDYANGSATPQSRTFDLNYQDTWHGALGVQYTHSPKWRFTGGAAYDTSAVDDADRTVTLPMGEAWRFGVGAQWQVSNTINLGAAYEFLWAGDMSVDQGSDLDLRGRVSGSYDDAWFSFFTLNATWKF
jgi:long-chain fatty acid transport protein